MNDSLFATLPESEREGLRTVRGIVICTIAGTAFWLSILVGGLIAWWLS